MLGRLKLGSILRCNVLYVLTLSVKTLYVLYLYVQTFYVRSLYIISFYVGPACSTNQLFSFLTASTALEIAEQGEEPIHQLQ
jgi:hypothetical protein